MRKGTLLLITVALILWCRLPYVLLPYPDMDQAEAMYHAQKILSGHALYGDSYTHHHPGAIWLSVIGKILAPHSHLTTNYLAILCMLIASMLFFLILSKHYSINVLAEAALILGASYLTVDIPFYPQHVILIPLTALIAIQYNGLLKTRPPKSTLSGFLCGLSFIFDQRALLFLLPTALHNLLSSKTSKGTAALKLIFGFAIPTVLFLISLIWTHSLNDYLYQCWYFPLTKRTGAINSSSLLATSLELHKVLLINLGALLILAVAGFFLKVNSRSSSHHQPRWHFAIFFISWAIALATIATAGHQNFEHYLMVWLPLLTLLAAETLKYITNSFTIGPLLSTFLTIIICQRGLSEPIKQLYQTGHYFIAPLAPVSERAGLYLKERLQPQEDLFVWGYQPQVYLYADHLSNFKHVNLVSITGAWFSQKSSTASETSDGYIEFQRYLESTPPRFFIIYDDPTNWKTTPERILEAYYDEVHPLHSMSRFVLDIVAQKYVLKTIITASSPTPLQPERFWIFERAS